MEYKDIPPLPNGVGGGLPTRWIYSEHGRFLSVYGIRNHTIMNFNLSSADDINTKLKRLYAKRDAGLIDNLDLQELEERLRINSNLTVYGNGYEPPTTAAIDEAKPTTSQRQLNHLERIRPLAHTIQANNKRRNTILTKKEEKEPDVITAVHNSLQYGKFSSSVL